MIADKEGEAWIMNTIDNDWVARKITPSKKNIHNGELNYSLSFFLFFFFFC